MMILQGLTPLNLKSCTNLMTDFLFSIACWLVILTSRDSWSAFWWNLTEDSLSGAIETLLDYHADMFDCIQQAHAHFYEYLQ